MYAFIAAALASTAIAALIAAAAAMRLARAMREHNELLAASARSADDDYRRLLDHRIANPLTVIGGAAQTLLDSDVTPDRETSRQLLELIASETERLAHVSLARRTPLRSEEQCLAPLSTATTDVAPAPAPRRPRRAQPLPGGASVPAHPHHRAASALSA